MKSGSSQVVYGRFLRDAVAVSLLVNITSLFLFYWSHGLSPLVFSDQDEPYYLQLALDRGRQYLGKAPLMEATMFSELSHNMADSVVGTLAEISNLSAAGLGLLLDLICVPLSYLAAIFLFSSLSRSQSAVRVAALLSLLSPNLLSLIPGREIGTLGTVLFQVEGPAGSLKILRAIATQLSIPLFFVAAGLLSRVIQSERVRPSHCVLVGLCGGALLYVYFFAWGAFGLLLCSWASFLFLQKPSRRSQLVHVASLIAIGLAAASLPGLVPQLTSPSAEDLRLTAEMRSWVTISPGSLILLFAAAVAIRRSRLELLKATLFLACVFSSVVPYLLQPLIGVTLTPYHYSLLFMNPIMIGCGSLLLAEQQIFSPRIKRAAAAIVLSAVFFSLLMEGRQKILIAEASKDADELVKALQDKVNPEESFTMIPFPAPFRADLGTPVYNLTLPLEIQTLAERRYWRPTHDAREGVLFGERVHSLGALYSGTKKPLATCFRGPSPAAG